MWGYVGYSFVNGHDAYMSYYISVVNLSNLVQYIYIYYDLAQFIQIWKGPDDLSIRTMI